MLLVPSPSLFISPARPTLRDRPPHGDGWVHEVKFDGSRVQLHKAGNDVVIFSRNGADFTSRWPAIAYALQHLPTKSAIIDAEVVACNAKGMPDFAALHGGTAKPEEFCAWAFDLLEFSGVGMRERTLSERRSRLQRLIARFDNSFLRFSEGFSDADKLLAECERLGLEGIVSKRWDQPYRAGRCDWVKVKTKAWREANRDRGELLK
jgi:bifunctional non-homologous end joining protein LigD